MNVNFCKVLIFMLISSVLKTLFVGTNNNVETLCSTEVDFASTLSAPNSISDVRIGMWLAVIYNKRWYSGRVKDVKEDFCIVNFMRRRASSHGRNAVTCRKSSLTIFCVLFEHQLSLQPISLVSLASMRLTCFLWLNNRHFEKLICTQLHKWADNFTCLPFYLDENKILFQIPSTFFKQYCGGSCHGHSQFPAFNLFV